VRSVVGVGLLLLCPVLAGCSLFRDKRNDTAKRDGATGRPFTGTPTATGPSRTERDDAAGAPSVYSGVLAGYVRDRFNKELSNCFIQVVDLSDTGGKAQLDVAADSKGQFVIPRLVPGHTYKLTARVKDGDRLLAGISQATPPNPKIAIFVSEDLVGPDTPPLPGPPVIPGRTTEPKDKETKPTPAAGLGAPIKPALDVSGPTDPGTRIQPPVVVPAGPVDKTNIVEGPGGFKRKDPPVDVPGPKAPDNIPPPPPSIPGARTEERSPLGTTPRPGAESSRTDAVPATPTPVPSCVLIGKKVENFALLDLEGNPWEYRKDKKGRLVLLQFWSSTSPECLAGLKDLHDLNAKYEPFGLQVVSIAFEEGPWLEQVQHVRSARGRYGLFKFVGLLGGGGQGPCPVREQFAVEKLPELVLLGEDGQILWRSRGTPDADRLWELHKMITQRLRISEQ
jgi:hypothetical protein